MAKKRGIIIGASAVVLAVGGYLAYAVQNAAHEPGPAPSSTAAPATVGVVAGSGGKSLGADGKTRVGYEPTCEGAVQAMTNYLSGLRTFNPADTSKQAALAKQVFTPDSTDRLTETQWVKTQASMFKIINATGSEVEHPEWGGVYKIFSCEPGKAATVGIFSCGENTVHAPKKGSWGGSACSPFLSSLTWMSDDWKIAKFNNDEDFLHIQEQEWLPHDASDPKQKPEFPLSKAVIAKSLTDSHGKPIEGWVDYANVTRK